MSKKGVEKNREPNKKERWKGKFDDSGEEIEPRGCSSNALVCVEKGGRERGMKEGCGKEKI